MISVYAQYSFGGYKIFKLSENSVEEVTAINRLELPDSAIQLFSHYGIKLLSARDLAGKYVLFVNDIPCQEKDDMGRAKTCAVVFTGTSLSDADTLRTLAVMIAFELDQFEKFFSGLFSATDSLNFDYKKFDDFIRNAVDEEVVSQDKLRNEMSHRRNPIVVYTTVNPEGAITPLYRNFDKKYLSKPFLLKWNENTRTIQNSAIDRIGFRTLLYKIINKLTAIWKN